METLQVLGNLTGQDIFAAGREKVMAIGRESREEVVRQQKDRRERRKIEYIHMGH